MAASEQSNCLPGGSELQAQVWQLGRHSCITFYDLASEVTICHFCHTLLAETATKACLLLMGGEILLNIRDPNSLFNNVKFTLKKKICSMGDTRLVALFGKYNLSPGSYYLLWTFGLSRMLCFFLMGEERRKFSLKAD